MDWVLASCQSYHHSEVIRPCELLTPYVNVGYRNGTVQSVPISEKRQLAFASATPAGQPATASVSFPLEAMTGLAETHQTIR